MTRIQSSSKRRGRIEWLLFSPSLTSDVFILLSSRPKRGSHVFPMLLISVLVLSVVLLVCSAECPAHLQSLMLVLFFILDLENCVTCSPIDMLSYIIWVQLYKSLFAFFGGHSAHVVTQNAYTLCLAMQSQYYKICWLQYFCKLIFGFKTSQYWFYPD